MQVIPLYYIMSSKKKFVLENLHIDRYAAEGKCIGHQQDKVIFVEGVVPGDVADVFVFKNKKDWAEAKVNRISTYSADRVEPVCSHFGACGGCKWQMLPYPLQLQYKEQQVKDQLKRLGHIDIPEFLPIKGCSESYQYRNKLEFTFSNKQYLTHAELQTGASFDKNVLGFHAPRLFDKVLDIQHCHLQPEPSNAIRNYVKAYGYEHGLSFYDIRHHTGFLRNLVIRTSTLGEVLVNLVVGEDRPETIMGLLQSLQQAFPAITSLHYTVNQKLNDSIYDLDVVHAAGKDHIEERLEKYRFRISPKSFFQTNTQQAEELYRITRSFAGLTGKETVYDLYCGTGSIGIFLSGQAGRVIGVETVEDAVADAKKNAALNNLSNTGFFAGDVIKVCNTDFFNTHGQADLVIIDPPRAGCHEKLIDKLLEVKAEKIVYVSCNPATQARDLALLARGYDCVRSQAVDMFPHTHHVENVVLLQRRQTCLTNTEHR